MGTFSLSPGLKRVAIGVLGLFVVGGGVAALVSVSKASRAASEEQALLALRNACEVAWVKSRQRDLKDPVSLQWEAAPAERASYQGKSVVSLRYRAMNAYGGFTPQQAVCEVDPRTGKILRVLE